MQVYALHLRTQRNQPYGSVRLCCERCGAGHPAAVGEYLGYVRETDNEDEYNRDPSRCNLLPRWEPPKMGQLSLPGID